MGYLLIKNFNKSNIQIHQTSSYYNIGYKVDYLTLSSIPIELTNITMIPNKTGYNITLNDIESQQIIQTIDTHLVKYIEKYKQIVLRDPDNLKYLYFKDNEYIRNNVNKDSDSLIINIIKLKKYASHTYPIVYIL